MTGASGFIGSHLVQALVASGDYVRALVRTKSDVRYLPGGVERYVGDLTDSASLHGAVAGIDRIFHCGAVVSDWGDPAVFRTVNVTGTQYLVTASFKAGVRKFVHVSSTDVYGYPEYPVTEDCPFQYRGWPYGDTKIDAEKVVREASLSGLSVTVIRPATVYGPRSVVIKEIVELLRRREMVFIGRGDTDAGLCYVDNLTEAIILAGDPALGCGRAYNVADGIGITWQQLVDRLSGMTGFARADRRLPRVVAYGLGRIFEIWGHLRKSPTRPLLTRMSVELLSRRQDFPAERLRAELGWEPKVSFEAGLLGMNEWIKTLVGEPLVQSN